MLALLFIFRENNIPLYEGRGTIMKIKVGKFEANVSGGLLLLGAIIADNMYSNHCKKKSLKEYFDVMKDLEKGEKKS